MNKKEEDIILFFDGVCGLCNYSVDFIIRQDTNQCFKFAPLQGKKAKECLPPSHSFNPSSLIVVYESRLLVKAEAVLFITDRLGFPYSLLNIGKLLPLACSNWIYDRIATNRYKLFGRSDACRMPLPSEMHLFYD